VFVANTFNGAYYLQASTVNERERTCNAIKTMSCKPQALSKLSKIEILMKEWYIRLGHVNKDKLIDMISNQFVQGIPYADSTKLRKVNFFCSTYAEMKMKRMPYKNLKGSRDERPISTIHMNTNGTMKTVGVYGTVGTIRYFLSIIDDQPSWRWTYVSGIREKSMIKLRRCFYTFARPRWCDFAPMW
jgi:hypothetical protein